MNIKTVVLLFGLVAGCDSGTFVKRVGQDKAEKLIWNELYSMKGKAPPVEWIHHFLTGGFGGFTIIGSRVQVSDAAVDDTYGLFPISSTSLAHEWMHYKTWIETGDVDPWHWRGDWNLADNVAHEVLAVNGL
jgi:hypothetical protein